MVINMNLLFITYDFYPNFGANSNIVYRLSKSFLQAGHEVHIMTLKPYPDLPEHEVWQKIYIHRINSNFDKTQVKKCWKEAQVFTAVQLSKDIFLDRFVKEEYKKKHWIHHPFKQLKYIISQYDLKAIINVCYPFESCLPMMKYLEQYPKNFRWIIYMQDPFATNYYYLMNYPRQELVRFQSDVFSLADNIVVTSPIYKELQSAPLEIQNKLKELQFPLITKPELTQQTEDIEFNRRYINCVYVGKLNKDTRNPKRLFQLFETLKEDSIRLHMIGEELSPWKRMVPPNATNIIFHGIKSKEVCINAELNANILVNLGNSINNQLPSKLLEYISTGKPIVNLYKVEDCPTLQYLQRYPYHFSILEKNIERKTPDRLYSFCMRYRKERLNYSYIKNTFYDCTLEYVSEEFLKLCSLKE
ncbi:MAG: glycosyl transferase family [Herbinix sp.]|jgi:glycosyltransferase involved in cell wall biosynthesis|nr:glycosyl transferase family [Herbinix sp.]